VPELGLVPGQALELVPEQALVPALELHRLP
jgi:hypothetical protein